LRCIFKGYGTPRPKRLSSPPDPDPTAPDKSLERAELDALRPTLAPIARVAKALFGASAADVNIFIGDQIWRASDRDGELALTDPASAITRLGDAVVWVPDCTKDERFRDHDAITGPMGLRLYAGAAIQLETGARVGALAVYDQSPRAYDPALAARLHDLAVVVANEFSRTRAMRERSELLETSKRSEERLKLALEIGELRLWEMDYRRAELTTGGGRGDKGATPMTT
jgi:GAF domain-containing protein